MGSVSLSDDSAGCSRYLSTSLLRHDLLGCLEAIPFDLSLLLTILLLLLKDPVIIVAAVLGGWDPLGPLGFGWAVEIAVVLARGVDRVIYNRWMILLVPLLLDGALGPAQLFQVDVIDLLGVHHQGVIACGVLITFFQVIEVKLVVLVNQAHGSPWGLLGLILQGHVVV